MRTPFRPQLGWMTRTQAARYLGISEWKLAVLVKRYAILANRTKGTYTYKVEDIEALARTLFESLKDDSL